MGVGNRNVRHGHEACSSSRDGNCAYFRTRKFQRSKTATEKQDNKPKKNRKFRSSTYAGHDESYSCFNHLPITSRESVIWPEKGLTKSGGMLGRLCYHVFMNFLETEKESAICKFKNK